MAWNPRFVAYCRTLGLSPQETLERDSEGHRGGRMCGFILWISERWQEFDQLFNDGRRPDVRFPEEHQRFDTWLQTRTEAADGN